MRQGGSEPVVADPLGLNEGRLSLVDFTDLVKVLNLRASLGQLPSGAPYSLQSN